MPEEYYEDLYEEIDELTEEKNYSKIYFLW